MTIWTRSVTIWTRNMTIWTRTATIWTRTETIWTRNVTILNRNVTIWTVWAREPKDKVMSILDHIYLTWIVTMWTRIVIRDPSGLQQF